MQTKIIQVCAGRACSEHFSPFIKKRLEADRGFYGYPEEVIIEDCLCQGRCKDGPTVIFDNDIQIGMNPIKASEILRKKVNDWKNREKKETVNKEAINSDSK
ncbi:(2Fe-2S) ferredoxin domain-containing protein [Candidatus Gracilibacteria bacterium]|nr:(2Fe-2S) ferredoxin domain-containing protein [Candidatus Gracilibacteria bacterium]